jgi:hypothetical protein
VHNTIVTPYLSAVVDLSAPKARAHFAGNIVWDGGASPGRQELASARAGADLGRVAGTRNWFSPGFSLQGTKIDPAQNTVASKGEAPGFADPGKNDYRLAAPGRNIVDGGPALKDVKIPPVPGASPGDPDLSWQYQHPCSKEKRGGDKKPDLGAFEKK